jgi:hypothetical protein
MRITRDHLTHRLIVQRTATGSAPYQWEVHADGLSPLQVSPDRFRSMEAAHKAGEAWLADFFASRQSARPRSPCPTAAASARENQSARAANPPILGNSRPQ